MHPKIYQLEEHNITANKIDHHAYYVIEKLKEAGFISYLVGGSVRDLLLNQKPKDFDISTSAKPEEIRKNFKNSILIGRRFRLAHIRFGRKILEVSTFRAGDIEESSLITSDNIWGSPEEDVLRRDFTINGLFYNPENQTIIDYVDGFQDAQKKLLKTIGKSSLRFIQDPVRMIRLLKFRARFGLSIDDEALEALQTCRQEILKSSPHRILEEFLRMLESGFSKEFFLLLKEHQFLKLLLPSLDKHMDNGPKLLLSLLEQIDSISLKIKPLTVDRALLSAPLIFPILQEKMASYKNYHLGVVSQVAHELIDSFFAPFFHFPRGIKVVLVSILVNQFRFTMSERIRIPRDPSLPLALKFLKMRAEIDNDLLPAHNRWHEALINTHHVQY